MAIKTQARSFAIPVMASPGAHAARWAAARRGVKLAPWSRVRCRHRQRCGRPRPRRKGADWPGLLTQWSWPVVSGFYLRLLHVCFFAAHLLAARCMGAGAAVGIFIAYTVVRRIAAQTPAAHVGACRRQTALAVAAVVFGVWGPHEALAASVILATCPTAFLWWPKKGRGFTGTPSWAMPKPDVPVAEVVARSGGAATESSATGPPRRRSSRAAAAASSSVVPVSGGPVEEVAEVVAHNGGTATGSSATGPPPP
jgi:hypothetical protein